MASHSWYSRVWSTAGGSLDRLYAGVIHSIGSTKFFRAGWGDISLLSPSKFYRALVALQLGQRTLTVSWKPVQTGIHRGKPFQLFEGTFDSPACEGVSNLPLQCQEGRVWLMRPGEAAYGPTGMSACVIQLAATGEHGPERRQLLGKSLLPQGIGTLVLESPYYGGRKPRGQIGSKVQCVADLIKLGAATILEALCLIRLLRAAGVTNVCIAGWSMGGIHACMTAAFSRFPVACAAMLPPRSAAAAYCDGALSEFVQYSALRSARDATGMPILPSIAHAFQAQLPYPNVPLLLDPQTRVRAHAGHAGHAAGTISSTGCPDLTGAAAVRSVHVDDGKGDMPGETVLGMLTANEECDDVLRKARGHWDDVDGRSMLPPLSLPHGAFEVTANESPSSTLFDNLPRSVPLTPHLRRFLTALNQLELPLWRRGKQGGRRHRRRRRSLPRPRALPLSPTTPAWMRQSTPDSSSAAAPLTPQEETRVIDELAATAVAPESPAAGGAAPVHVLRPPPPQAADGSGKQSVTSAPLLSARLEPHLRSATALLQQLSFMQSWIKNNRKGLQGIPTVQRARPQVHKPPSVVLHRHLGPHAYRATMQDLLIAELESLHHIQPRRTPERAPEQTVIRSDTGRTHRESTEYGEPVRPVFTRRPPKRDPHQTIQHKQHRPARCDTVSKTSEQAWTRQLQREDLTDGRADRSSTAAAAHRRRIGAVQAGDLGEPVAAAGETSTLPPVAAYRRAIARSLRSTLGTVTGPLRLGGQRYTQLLNSMISGGTLLGPVDGGEGGGGALEGGEAAARATQQPGAETLLALTLEAFTDLCRYPRPIAAHAAVLVAARDDAYVAVQSTEAIAARWRGSELWHAEGGHVSSFLLLNPLYLKAITRSLEKLQTGPDDGAEARLGARADGLGGCGAAPQPDHKDSRREGG